MVSASFPQKPQATAHLARPQDAEERAFDFDHTTLCSRPWAVVEKRGLELGVSEACSDHVLNFYPLKVSMHSASIC